MGKVTKICDFDPPETPTERIIRGLTIALGGAQEEAKQRYKIDYVDDISRMITSVKECAKYLENENCAREKYAKELGPAIDADADIRFDFDESSDPWKPCSLIIESTSATIEYELDPENLKKSIKAGVAAWMRKEARKRGKKTKIAG